LRLALSGWLAFIGCTVHRVDSVFAISAHFR